MNRSLRAGERGVSVLGALVAALALSAGSVATFELATPPLSSISPDSQLAQAAAAPKAAPKVDPAEKDEDDFKAQQKKACDELIKKSVGAGEPQSVPVVKMIRKAGEKGQVLKGKEGTGDTIGEKGEALVDLCLSVRLKTPKANPKDPKSYECRGRTAEARVSNNTVTSLSIPDSNADFGECRTLTCRPAKITGKLECFATQNKGGYDPGSELGVAWGDKTKSILDESKLNTLGIGGSPLARETDAIAKSVEELESKVEEKTAAKNTTSEDVQKKLDAIAACTSCSDADKKWLERELAAAKARDAAAEKDLEQAKENLANLRDNQQTLAGEAAKGPPMKEEELPDGRIRKTDDKGNVQVCDKDGKNCTTPTPGPGTQTPGPGTHSPGGNTSDSGAGNSKGGGMGDIGSLLKSLGSLFNQQQQQLPCVSDQNQYNQQLQSYQMQLQSYNQQLQQYNYTRQLQSAYGSTGFTPEPPTQPAQPCYKPPSTNTCQQAPAQPNPTGCQNGSWKPIYTGACLSGWQCVPTSGSEVTAIVAQITCKPPVVDVGMSVSIDYSCSAGTSEGGGFETGGVQSGTASVTVANPPAGTNVATFGLKCTNGSGTTTKQCSVQIAKPAIVLVANPKAIAQGKTSAIGWVTSGMKSCVISSPDLSSFTEQHKNSTNVNGTVATPPLSSPASFVLSCTTLGGATKQATTQVSVQ